MSKSELIRVDGKTYQVLKDLSIQTDVPIGKLVKRKVFGVPAAKVKRMCEY